MMKHATLNKAIIGIMFLLLVTSLVNVSATTTTDDDTTTEDETVTTTETETESSSGSDDDSNNRDVTVTVTPIHAEIESELESGGTEDSFKIEVDVGEGGVEFKIEFETESTVNVTEREFEVDFDSLVEYIDVNENGVYDDSVDNEVQTLELINFEPIAYSIDNVSGIPVHIFDVITTDGIFGARIYATGDFANINDSIIVPTQVKIDVMINNFSFTNNDTQLALKVELSSELETSFDDITEDEDDGRAVDEAALDFIMTDINGFFSWKESAEIDGVTHMVNSSIHEVSANETEIYLNYPQGDEIIHDPKIGFESLLLPTDTTSGTSSGTGVNPIGDLLQSEYLPLIAAVAAIAVIGVIIVVKRR
jgi:hypothetical protein